MNRSGSAIRLDPNQRDELLLEIDPGLIMQAAQRHSSNTGNHYNNNNNGNHDDQYFDSSSSVTSSQLSPPHNQGHNSSFRRKSPSSIRFRGMSSPSLMSSSPAITPRIVRRAEEDIDLQSLASSATNNSSPTSSNIDSPSKSKYKKKSSKSNQENMNMSIQLLPYVNSAMELAAEQLGSGTSLRKVSVVKQNVDGTTTGESEDSPSKGIFGIKRKKKRDEAPKALVFSFSKADLTSSLEAGSQNSQDSRSLFRTDSNYSQNFDGSRTPKISVTSADFTIGEEPLNVGRPLKRYDSDVTLTSEILRQNSNTSNEQNTSKENGQTETGGQNDYHFSERNEDSNRRISTASSTMQRKLTLDQLPLQPQHLMPMQNNMLSPFNRYSSDTQSVRSFRSQTGSSRLTQSSDNIDSASNEIVEKEKKMERRQRFWDYFTMVSSIIYAIGILVTSIIIYSIDLFVYRERTTNNKELSEYLNIVLIVVGSAWLIWLMVDINRYIGMMKDYWRNGGEADGRPVFQLVEGDDGELLISIPITSAPKKLPQYYCFATGRHSGSFFLKIGATLFCLGHIIHIILNLIKQIIFKLDDAKNATDVDDAAAAADDDADDVLHCGSYPRIFFQVLQPLYVLLQLYMMYKYSNVIVNRSKGTARFAFMHCIATSIVFWIYTLLNETIDYIVKKYSGKIDGDCEDVGNTRDSYEGCPAICPVQNLPAFNFEFSIQCLVNSLCHCNKNNSVADAIFEFGDYLYPFSIEFSILIVGVWYIMWSNIGKVEEHKNAMEFLPSPRRSIDSGTGKPNNDALYMYADCHSSTKGIFLGMCHLVFCITGTIVCFILIKDYCNEFRIVNDVIECLLIATMIGASIWVYFKISQLDINPHPIQFLDDLLLLICIPSFFLYGFFSGIPAVMNLDRRQIGNIVTNVLMVIQVLIQTPMIVDGLRRCCDGQVNQQRKPGRNLVTFLIISNLSLYIWDTLEAKSDGFGSLQKDFYGVYLWTIVKHTTLPLCIFYRFHSSVALADIWNSAYRPGDHH